MAEGGRHQLDPTLANIGPRDWAARHRAFPWASARAGTKQKHVIRQNRCLTEKIHKQNLVMFQDLQNEMTAKFLSVQDMIQDQLQMVLEMVPEIVDESNKKMTESWAEITKKKEANQTHAVAEVQQQQQRHTTQQFITIMKQALEESKREEQINEDRQCSIVVHILKESSKDKVEERKEEERELANRLCIIGARVQGCQVMKTFRLGKYDKNSTKP